MGRARTGILPGPVLISQRIKNTASKKGLDIFCLASTKRLLARPILINPNRSMCQSKQSESCNYPHRSIDCASVRSRRINPKPQSPEEQHARKRRHRQRTSSSSVSFVLVLCLESPLLWGARGAYAPPRFAIYSPLSAICIDSGAVWCPPDSTGAASAPVEARSRPLPMSTHPTQPKQAGKPLRASGPDQRQHGQGRRSAAPTASHTRPRSLLPRSGATIHPRSNEVSASPIPSPCCCGRLAGQGRAQGGGPMHPAPFMLHCPLD